MLLKGPSGYSHKFHPKNPLNKNLPCKICGEDRYEHQSEAERRMQLFFLEEPDLESQIPSLRSIRAHSRVAPLQLYQPIVEV